MEALQEPHNPWVSAEKGNPEEPCSYTRTGRFWVARNRVNLGQETDGLNDHRCCLFGTPYGQQSVIGECLPMIPGLSKAGGLWKMRGSLKHIERPSCENMQE
jgi:hypothetical protein